MKTDINICALKELLITFLTSVIVGASTGCIIFGFKYVASYVIKLSNTCYLYVRENPEISPVFLFVVVILSFMAFIVIKWDSLSKGGGVATAFCAIKGYISLKWLKNLLSVFIGANISFAAGLPLGNEGPSVQIGTNIGKGTAVLFKRKANTQKELMAVGATCGFACATFAPISAFAFAFEEIKLKLSLLRISSLLMSIITGTAVNCLLGKICGISPYLFDFKITYKLPLRYILCVIVIGIACGISAFAFGKLHLFVFDFVNRKIKKLHLAFKLAIVFVAVFVSGFFLPEILGSGHSLIEHLAEKNSLLSFSVLILVLRFVFLILLNSVGATGGTFLPNLALGALVGSVMSNLFLEIGIIEEKFVPIIIIVSIVAFLAATLKAPIIAICFSFEVFGGIYNIVPILLAVSISFFIVKILKFEPITEVIVERKGKL